jgi:ABC-2 type transport system permease protein
MRTIWLIARHDVGVTLRQRSFWFLALLMPLLLMGFQAFGVLQGSGVNLAGGTAPGGTGGTASPPQPIGLVDLTGAVKAIPAGLPTEFILFPDASAASAALQENTIAQYVVLPASYLSSGQATVYGENVQLLGGGSQSGFGIEGDNTWMLNYIVDYNLTGSAELATALRNPTPSSLATPHVLQPPPPSNATSGALAELISTILPFAFYFLLLMGSSYLMRSVVAEKENRTAEVLLVSIDPRQLMVGKILAMTLVLVLQLIIWVGGGIVILNVGADLLNVARLQFPPGFFAWAILFLLLGYLLYASIMAAAGAIAPNAREGAQVTWILILPLMPTLMFGNLLISEPESALTLVLSLFPFSSPSAMVTRLAVGGVPLWQLLVSVALLAATTYLFVILAARFFQAGNLLSESSFNWRRLLTGWRE